MVLAIFDGGRFVVSCGKDGGLPAFGHVTKGQVLLIVAPAVEFGGDVPEPGDGELAIRGVQGVAQLLPVPLENGVVRLVRVQPVQVLGYAGELHSAAISKRCVHLVKQQWLRRT